MPTSSEPAPPPEVIAELTQGATHLFAAKCYILASLVLSIYEYFITFGEEVEFIWKQKFSFVNIFWILCRYFIILAYVITNAFLHIPVSKQVCENWVKWPGATNMVALAAVNATLMVRVYSLYARKKWVLFVLVPLYGLEVALQSWALNVGTQVELPPGLVGCILTGKPGSGSRLAAFWIAETIFPSAVFVLTIIRALALKTYGGTTPLLALLIRDGALYFGVIVGANLLNVIAYLTWPSDISSINAPFCQLITSLMICRLILNLREKAAHKVTFVGPEASKGPGRYRLKWWEETTTLLGGSLGGDSGPEIKFRKPNMTNNGSRTVVGNGIQSRDDLELTTIEGGGKDRVSGFELDKDVPGKTII